MRYLYIFYTAQSNHVTLTTLALSSAILFPLERNLNLSVIKNELKKKCNVTVSVLTTGIKLVVGRNESMNQQINESVMLFSKDIFTTRLIHCNST